MAGLHIGIVMGLVFGATRFGLALWQHVALRWPTRQMAALAALAAGGVYLALTGAHVPIIRSFAMAALVTLGVLTGRRAISLRGLALAATVLLVLPPDSVMGVSFQMSFAAVLTLIAGYEMARPHLARLGAGGAVARTGAVRKRADADEFAGGNCILAVRRVSFRQGDIVLCAGEHGGGAADGALGDAVGAGGAGADAIGAGAAGAGADGLGDWRPAGDRRTGVAGWPDAVVAVPQMPGWALALVALGMVWAGLWRGWLRLGGVVPLAVGLAAVFLVRAPDVLVTPGRGG